MYLREEFDILRNMFCIYRVDEMIPLLCLHAAVNRWSAWLGLKKGKCGAMYALLKLQDIFTRQSKITLFDPLYLV